MTTPINTADALEQQREHTVRLAIIEAAAARIGVREIGFTNTGPEVDEYLAYVGLLPGNSWCAAFACYCLHLAGATPGMVRPTGYVPTLADDARRNGYLVDAADAARPGAVQGGDLVVVWETFPDSAQNDYHHTGIVASPPDENGWFESIEGNTNTDGEREGYEVARQRRHLADKATDGHARYSFVRTV